MTDSMMSKKPRGWKRCKNGNKEIKDEKAKMESENEGRNVQSILNDGVYP